MEEQSARQTSTEDLLTQAREQWRLAADAESEWRQLAYEDKRFAAGEHWPDDIKAKRDSVGRPCLTINRVPQFVKQITAQQRASKPTLQVKPVDDAADTKTAEIFQALIKHIEANSHAGVAYETAGENQAIIGKGFFRHVTEYCNDRSFDLDIRIKRVRNPFTVYFDPTCQEPDYCDARYAFIIEDLPRSTFTRLYPGKEAASLTNFATRGDIIADGWITQETIRIAEYFWVDFEKDTLYRLADGTELLESELETYVLKQLFEMLRSEPTVDASPEGVKTAIAHEKATATQKRDVQKRVVRWDKISAVDVLERTVWPGPWIPIFPMIGDEIDIDGKVDYQGIVRALTDPARMYNYWVSAETEAIALAPKAPFKIAVGQVEGFEHFWETANTENWAYLPYKETSVGGVAVPPPAREYPNTDISAIAAAIQQADNDQKAVSGLFDASLGERGPEQSGKAIMARQRAGEMGNSHYLDNFARALWHSARSLIATIPKVYDTPRVMHIMGIDDKPATVMVHAGQAPDPTAITQRDIQEIYDLGVGQYDVTVDAGPSAGTRRQEALELVTNMMQASPELMPIVGDIFAGLIDHSIGRQLQQRFKQAFPQWHTDETKAGIPKEVQQQMQQAQQAIQMLTEQLKAAQLEIHTKQQLKQDEFQHDERMEHIKQRGKLVQLTADADNDAKLEILKAQLEQTTGYVAHHTDRIAAREDRDADRAAAREDRDADRFDALHERDANRFEAHHERQATRVDTREARDAERAAAREDRQHEARQPVKKTKK